MLMQDHLTTPEKYSSYKARMFEKRMNKLNSLVLGIDDLSLKPKDKEALRAKMITMIQSKLQP